MDLGSHRQFNTARASDPMGAGWQLVSLAWQALQERRAESVDIELRGGTLIEGLRDIRIDGAIAEGSLRRGIWDHGFALSEVIRVRFVPHGGKRD